MTDHEREFSRVSWSNSDFVNYLRKLAIHSQEALPTVDYPIDMSLSKDWKNLLNQMRKASTDGNERMSLIAFRHNKILLQMRSAVGTPDSVPSVVFDTYLQGATAARMKVIGMIHSHPEKKLVKRSLLGLRNKHLLHTAIFSPADLYWLLKSNPLSIIGVVQGNEDLFAFRTSGTTGVPNLLNQDDFSKYWQGQNLDPWGVNREIALRHKLVLYKGISPGEIVKEFPI